MVESRERFTANNADIADMCASVERFLAREGLAERERTRLRLTMERLLRRISERRGWGTRCELALGRRWGRPFILLSYLGEAFDPTLVGRESESEAWSARLLTELGLVPEWSWRRGVNRLLLRVRSAERWALLAPLAAVVLGVALRLALAAVGNGWAEAAERYVFAPLLRAFCGVAAVLLVPKLFLAPLAAVCGAAETVSSRSGRLTVSRFLAWDALCALAGAAAFAALCGVRFAGGTDLAPLWRLVPASLASPLRSAPQLALLGALFGAALHARGGGGAERLRAGAEECAAALDTLLGALCRLTPAAILLAVCRVPAAALLQIWKPLAAFALCAGAITLCMLLAAAVRLRVRPSRLLARVLPPAAPALRRGSFAAAFGETMDACENELKLAHPLVLTGLSLGSVLWKPLCALYFCAPPLYLAAARGAEAGVGTLALAALTGLALSASLDARPGASLLGLALLPLSATPEEFALCAALDAPLAALCAALSVAALELELLSEGALLPAEAR